MSKRKASHPSMAERADPKLRGVHPDAIQASIAPTSRSECTDCGRPITKDSVRWGIKYAGNPLAGVGEGVIPLYGSHPMVMWCHAGGCGLRYQRARDIEGGDAARTCHLCSDTPDSGEDDQPIKLLCGGGAKGKKIRQHAFHIRCWRRAIESNCTLDDGAAVASILVDPTEVRGWDELNESEQEFVRRCTSTE